MTILRTSYYSYLEMEKSRHINANDLLKVRLDLEPRAHVLSKGLSKQDTSYEGNKQSDRRAMGKDSQGLP